MNPTPRSVAVLFAAAASLTAQGQTFSPAQGATGSGNSANWLPFGAGSATYQQVHSARSFSAPGPLLVHSMTFRVGRSVAGSIDVELRMADCPVDAANASSQLAQNVVPGTEVTVFARRNVSLPSGNELQFVFDRPFRWSGGHLSWRADVFGNSNGNSPTYFSVRAFSDIGTSTRTGGVAGCPSARGSAPATHFSWLYAPGSPAKFFGYSEVANTALPAALIVGTSDTSLSGVPLPFDLSRFGAPGCALTTSIDVVLPGTTFSDPRGYVEFRPRLPRNPALTGQQVHSQLLFLQPGANALGAFLSDGRTSTVGTEHHVTRLMAGLGATQGGVDDTYGLAVRLN